MNWKKALLITALGLFALVFFVVAAAGVLATAALGATAVAISESGVVQAFEEVADGARRLEIQVDENSVTFSNPDSGESRTLSAQEASAGGRIDWNLPQITVTDVDGGSRVVIPGLRGPDELVMPEITITDPDNGQSRVIRPNVEVRSDLRIPRVVWENHDGWIYSGPERGLRLVSGLVRGLFNLVALTLIVAGAYLLIRYRRRDQVDVDKTEKSA